MENWQITSSKTVDSGLPEDLPALRFPHRAKSRQSPRVCAVGDIVFSGGVTGSGEKIGYETLFSEVAPLLKGTLCFGNLECALTSRPASPGFLVGPVAAARGLYAAGIRLLNLANNHAYDAGPDGLASTLRAASEARLTILGAGDNREASRSLKVIEVHGVKVGWLACGRTLRRQAKDGPHFWEFAKPELVDAIHLNRDRVDVLFVSIHIGYEFIEIPSPEHRQLAHDCVAAGANVVLMHHAHVLQGVERVGEQGVICFNLGNFLMDSACGHVQVQTALAQRRTGAVFVFDLDRAGGCEVSVLPIYLDNDFCARWARGEQGREILGRLTTMAGFLKDEQALAAEFARQRAERNLGPILTVLGHHLCKHNWRILLGILAGIRPRHFRALLGMLKMRLLRQGAP